MANVIYSVNKGVNCPMEFKGLKAQYITYLGLGCVALLVGFAILYLLGVNTYICLLIVLVGGGTFISWLCRLSRCYGAHGLMKRTARRRLPRRVITRKRRIISTFQSTANDQNA